MSFEKDAQMNVATLFHSLLFAYEKAARKVLGSGCEVFVHPTLEILDKISEEQHLQLFAGTSLEEAVASFSKMLEQGKIVRKVGFRKIGPERYLLKIDGCAWAKHIHKELRPKDATCPYALIVMAIYRRYMGGKAEETESKYCEDGNETEIKPFHAATVSFGIKSLELVAEESLTNSRKPK